MIISYTFLNDAVRDSPDNFSAWGTCLPERLSLVLINPPDNLFEELLRLPAIARVQRGGRCILLTS